MSRLQRGLTSLTNNGASQAGFSRTGAASQAGIDRNSGKRAFTSSTVKNLFSAIVVVDIFDSVPC